MASKICLFVCFTLILIAVVYATKEEKSNVKQQLGEVQVREKRHMGRRWRERVRPVDMEDVINRSRIRHQRRHHDRRWLSRPQGDDGIDRSWRRGGCCGDWGNGRRGDWGNGRMGWHGRRHGMRYYELDSLESDVNDTDVRHVDGSLTRGYRVMHQRRGMHHWGNRGHGVRRYGVGNGWHGNPGAMGPRRGRHFGRRYGMYDTEGGNRFGGVNYGNRENDFHHMHHSEIREEGGDPLGGGLDPDTGLTPLSPQARRKLGFLSRAQNRFTISLHRHIGQVTDIVYSPYNIFQALTLVYMGSRSHTAFQMRRVLHLIGMGRHIHIPVMHQNSLLNDSGSATLLTANSLCIKPNISVSEIFLDRLESSYDASVSRIHLDHPDGPESPINEWVSDRTNSLIPTVMTPGTINDMTAMVVINAVYFKAKWKMPFIQDRTTQQMFSKTGTLQVPVQMMEAENEFKMGEVPGHAARVLELPYEGDRFSMLVILPDDVDGLTELEENLTPEILATSMETTTPAGVKVCLPRFKIESPLSLKNPLRNMGMTKAFDPALADFRGITTGNDRSDLYISDVIHRAVVEVNEEGSETGGASVTTMVDADPSSPTDFRCDHPFMFIIRDNISKVNLFVGKFSGGS